MQAIVETVFDILYLTTVITLGIQMIRRGRGTFRLFGIMAVVLGAGDAFHLVPRALALCTTGLDHYTVALGLGKAITSLTMTVFLCTAVPRVAQTVRGNRPARADRRGIPAGGRAN